MFPKIHHKNQLVGEPFFVLISRGLESDFFRKLQGEMFRKIGQKNSICGLTIFCGFVGANFESFRKRFFPLI